MDLDEHTFYCTICGGPIIREHEWTGEPTMAWLGKPFLLTSSEDDALFSLLDVDILDNQYFHIHQTQKDVLALDLKSHCRPTAASPDAQVYIPCHRSCLSVAEKAISTCEVDPLHRIWKILNSRAQRAKHVDPLNTLPTFILFPPGGWPGMSPFQDGIWGFGWDGKEEELEVDAHSPAQ